MPPLQLARIVLFRILSFMFFLATYAHPFHAFSFGAPLRPEVSVSSHSHTLASQPPAQWCTEFVKKNHKNFFLVKKISLSKKNNKKFSWSCKGSPLYSMVRAGFCRG